MPVRNVVRFQVPDTYYHVYNRGHNKDPLFIDSNDFEYFVFLLKRCFGPTQIKAKDGRLFPWIGDKITLNAFCLMPNHFHLLLLQGSDISALSKSMQSLATTYSMYFNKKYQRRGSIFESVFKASPILSDSYLHHISRYIHLNPKEYWTWAHSSYRQYLGGNTHSWVNYKPILGLFDDVAEYITFTDDYVDMRDELTELKYNLADHGQTYHNTI